MGSGGGGSSGKVEFPGYIETYHEGMLDGSGSKYDGGFNLNDAIEDADNANAYTQSAPSTHELDETIDDWHHEVASPRDNLDHQSDYTSALSTAVDDIIDKTDNVSDSVEDAVMNRLGDVVDDAETQETGIVPQSDWAEVISTAVGKDDVVPEVDTQKLAADTRDRTSLEFDEAVTKALEMVNSQVIEDLVDEFEQRVNDRLVNRKRRYSSIFADANAVHSSAFVIGHAILERDAQREVNRFDAETSQQLFQQGVQQHIQAYTQKLQIEAETRLQNAGRKLEFIQQGAQVMAQLISERSAKEQTFIQAYLQAFSRRMQLYTQMVQQETKGTYQAKRTDFELLLSERRARQAVASKVFSADMQGTEFDAKMDAKRAFKELRILREGATILGAPQGMGAPMPEEQSKVSEALGGALSGGAKGASIGAKTGTAEGTAIGAGVGAIIGGASQAF